MGLRFFTILTVVLAFFIQGCLPEIPRTAARYSTPGAYETSYQESPPFASKRYTGPKRRVAVLPVEGDIDYVTGRRVNEILKRTLNNSGQFEVRLGVSAGADYLVRVTVTGLQKYDSGGKGALAGAAQGAQGGGGLLGMAFGAIIRGALTFKPAEINARIELVDPKTERDLSSTTVSGEGTPVSSGDPDDPDTEVAEISSSPQFTPMDIAIREAMNEAVRWMAIHTPFTIRGLGSFVEFVSKENVLEKRKGNIVIASSKQGDHARVLEIADYWVKIALKSGKEGWVYKESLRPSDIDETFPPTISLMRTMGGSEVFKETIEVSGRVWANAKITTVMVNDQKAEVTQGTFLIKKYPLTFGENSVTIKATDELGNTATKGVKITRLRDTSPPEITVSSPRNNIIITGTTIDVSGLVRDNVGVALVKINDQEAEISKGTFRLSGFPLALGKNLLNIIAEDGAENRSETKTLVVVRKRDTIAPVVTIIRPAKGSEVRAESVTVSGRVTDNIKVASVTVNGRPAKVTKGEFTLERYLLRVGNNSIIVKAKDAEGNKATRKVAVTRVLRGKPGQKALSLEDIEDLLESEVSPKRVVDFWIPERGIKFQVTEHAKSRLLGAGADNGLIKSLEELFLRLK